jgi:hypothetical protein
MLAILLVELIPIVNLPVDEVPFSYSTGRSSSNSRISIYLLLQLLVNL